MKTKSQIDARDMKELELRKRQRDRAPLRFGIVFTLIALFFASAVDEIASAINVQLQSSVVTEFFANPLNLPFNEAMSIYSTITMFSYALLALVPFYKALADKLGRKTFLVLNTVGMAIGMFLCLWSPHVVVYFIGFALVTFFVQHDMQIVYLYEIVPKEKRASIYGLVKGLSTLAIVLLPVLRNTFMGNDSTLWRMVYLIPAIVALAVSALTFFLTRESRTFLDNRITYLESPYEERHPAKLTKEEKQAQKESKAQEKTQKSGVFHAFKHLFKNKQLFWVAIASTVFAVGSTTISGFSESIMTDFGMETESVTQALFIYPFIYAVLIIVMGFVGDKIGRKLNVTICGSLAVVGFIGFNVSAFLGANPYVVGLFYGLYLGCWWITLDYCSMMVAESSPTHNRGSMLGAVGLLTMIGSGIGQAVPIVAALLFKQVGFGYMTISMPFVIAGIVIVMLKVKETKGVDLDKVVYEDEVAAEQSVENVDDTTVTNVSVDDDSEK
ncbi:MAG: MFS transporter [Clostridia bacterium]|nr:MFS transporter [Clostridia bacterium]